MLKDQIRSLLLASDRSVTDLAEEIGVHRVSLQRFKSSGYALSLDKLEKLADSLGWEVVARPKKSRNKA